MMDQGFEALIRKLPPLGQFPRVALGNGATPLEPMAGVAQALGLDVRIKRDDLLPLAMGGNKVRQLEFYLGQANAENADTVLITGAVQSNFVRLCAAAARKLGWTPVVQLEDRVPKSDPVYNSNGNLLLLRLLGAEIHRFPEGENEAAADANLDSIAADLKTKGHRPFVIHLGMGHPPFGALGYVAAAVESYLQLEHQNWQPDLVVIPSGSGLTHAGFLVGARAIGWDVPVLGVCVRRNAEAQSDRIAIRLGEVTDLLGGRAIPAEDIQVSDTVLAPGYGQMNAEVHEAISLAAQADGILLDPVYSGRTFAGLIERARNGGIGSGHKVLFVHTGGTPALFAYENDLTGSG